VDGVVAVVLAEDKGVLAGCFVESYSGLEIAPHVIRGIVSADETVIPPNGGPARVNPITDEGVAAAFVESMGNYGIAVKLVSG
jgi:hypothetical protein